MSNIVGKIYVPGGVLSPGELRRIVSAAQYFGTENIHIGNRQDLLFNIDKKYEGEISKRVGALQYPYEIGEFSRSNIVTSFPAKNIFNSTPWLTEDLYLEILSSFTYPHKLKINIVDPFQALIPLFTGHLNFIASSFDNYWYLFLKLEDNKKPHMWPVLIDGNEIHAIAEAIEEVFFKKLKISPISLEGYIYNLRTWNFKVIINEFSIPATRFSNYEGFHALGDKYWLGIYQRDNSFPVNFIENLCILCAQTNIGNINITPWNSFIIKNIEEKDVVLWEKLLGRFGINTGHSHLELNWKLPELDKKAHMIKNYVFRAFEKTGLRTEGLIFGVSDTKNELGSSIFITRKSLITLFNKINLFTSYGIKYKKNFDPNSWEEVAFADGLKRRNLPDMLAYVAGMYYTTINKDSEENINFNNTLFEPAVEETKEVFQCKHCLTVYDPVFGDPERGVMAGVSFEDLSPDYTCSLCDAVKEDHIPVAMETLVVK